MAVSKVLNIFIDESGDYSPYSVSNPLYSVAFVMVGDDNNEHALNIFKNQLKNNDGGDHFVHTGNLVRCEKPYEGMLREKRQELFYSLFLFAKFAKYKVCCVNVVKKGKDNVLDTFIGDAIYEMVIEHQKYFSSFDRIILHYDNGQGILSDIIFTTFGLRCQNVVFTKTLQEDSPYMQVADLFSYFELIKYKIDANNLSKSEIAFFGNTRKIRKNYFEQLKNKFI